TARARSGEPLDHLCRILAHAIFLALATRRRGRRRALAARRPESRRRCRVPPPAPVGIGGGGAPAQSLVLSNAARHWSHLAGAGGQREQALTMEAMARPAIGRWMKRPQLWLAAAGTVVLLATAL